MALNINVRWADNTETLRRNLQAGLDQIEATRAGADRMVKALSGDNLVIAAHKYAAAVKEIGGVERLNAQEKERINNLVTKAIEKYELFGKTAPQALHDLANATKQAAAPTQTLTGLAENLGRSFGLLFSVTALVSFTKELAAAADQLTKLHDTTGISLQGLQRFQIAGDDAGNSIEELSGAIVKMEDRLAGGDRSANTALEKLGLNFLDLKRLTPENQFIAISDAIRKIQDPAEQVNIAIDLFGKSGASVLPTLKRGFDDLKGSAVGMSDETIRALDDAGDALGRFWRQSKGVTAELIVAFGRLASAGFNPMEYAIRRAGDELANTRHQLDEMIKSASAGIPVLKKVVPPGLPDDLETVERDLKRIQSANDAAWKKGIDDRKRYAESVEKVRDRVRELEVIMPGLREQVGVLNDTEIKAIEAHLKTVAAVEKERKAFEDLQATLRSIQRDDFSFDLRGLENVGTKVAILSESQQKAIKLAGQNAGQTYTQALEESLQRIPDIFKQAFTGGGGVAGALKAVAIDVAESIGRVLAQRIAQSLAQSNAANAAAGIASGGGGGGGGSVATKVAATIVTAGIYAGTLAVIALYKHFHDAEWEKLGKDIGRDLGVSLSESLLRAMEEDSKKLGRQAATLLHLNDIIDEAGGIAAFGFDKATKAAHDLFSMIETGRLTIKQAGATFDTLFGNLAKELGPNGLASKGFVELIKLNEQFGTKSAEVLQFVSQQVSKIVDGLMAFTSPGKAAADTLEDVKKQMEAIRVEREDLMKRGTLGDTDTKRLAELNKQWEELEKKAKSAQGVVDATAITSQNAATALGATVAASFAEMIKAGTPILDIFKTLDPIIDQLQKQFEAAGFTGGLAFDKIREMAALAKDEVAGPVIQGIIGLGQALTGLNNIGALDQDTFSGLTEQISSMYDSLVKQGKGGPAALRLLQAPLQTVWKLVHDFGYQVDDNTRALLEQAEAQGIVGDKMRPINEQMLEATNKIADAVEYLAEVFGYLPKAAKDAADGISDNLSKIKVPKIKIPYEWETQPGGAPPYIPSPTTPLPFPGAVSPAEWRATAQRGATSVSVRLSPTIYVDSSDVRDPDRVVAILDQAMRQDTGLIRTKIERIAQKAAEDAVV